MSFGPAEAFTSEQFAQLYDVNVLSAQRVNRAALPRLRKQGRGLVVWISSSSARGGTPPYLSPYFAAKAAMDCLESSLISPVIFVIRSAKAIARGNDSQDAYQEDTQRICQTISQALHVQRRVARRTYPRGLGSLRSARLLRTF
jgi:NADP-dependent 3-hydroxy acid dehydrogenase YdfG